MQTATKTLQPDPFLADDVLEGHGQPVPKMSNSWRVCVIVQRVPQKSVLLVSGLRRLTDQEPQIHKHNSIQA